MGTFKCTTFSILSIKLNRKAKPAFSSTLLVGMIFVVGTLLLFSPISIKAQGPTSNTTSAHADGQEENNKAIILAFTEAFNDRNYILPLNNLLLKI